MATTDQLTEPDAAVRTGAGLLDRSERGKLALTGAGAKELLQGQVTNDVEALAPGSGCYAALLTQRARCSATCAILDTGERAAGSTPSARRCRRSSTWSAAARIGFDAELHKRTLERGLLSLIGPRARAVAGPAAEALAEEEHANARGRDRRDPPCCSSRPTSGVDLICDAGQTAALRAALDRPRRRPDRRGGGRVPARRARPPALRRRPRRDDDPPGGRAQRARGLLHEGLLRRPGDGRAPALQGQAQPPPARAAALRARRRPARSCCSASSVVGTLGSVARSPAHGPIALALVRREAPPGMRLAAGEASAEVVELPF